MEWTTFLHIYNVFFYVTSFFLFQHKPIYFLNFYCFLVKYQQLFLRQILVDHFKLLPIHLSLPSLVYYCIPLFCPFFTHFFCCWYHRQNYHFKWFAKRIRQIQILCTKTKFTLVMIIFEGKIFWVLISNEWHPKDIFFPFDFCSFYNAFCNVFSLLEQLLITEINSGITTWTSVEPIDAPE